MKKPVFIWTLVALACGANAQNEIAIDLVTDQYGSESFWQIDGQGGSFYETGSGYADQDAPGSYPQPTEFVDLPDGTFSFCLGDAYDDGFCCEFGQGSITITHVASGTVLFHSEEAFGATLCTTFTVPFASVQGTLYLDADHDCAPGTGEVRVPGQVIKVMPGDHTGFTDAEGNYAIMVPYGSYTVGVASNGFVPICPEQPIAVSTSDVEPIAQALLGDSSIAKLDLVATMASGPARPGFQVHHALNISNASAYPTGPVSITATLDPLLTYLEADPQPQDVSGNVLTWELPALGVFQWHPINVYSQLPPDPELLGDEVSVSVSAHQTEFEPVLTNNQCSLNTTITGSFDPNDKLVRPAELYALDTDTILDYTIRFQNTGTDTAFTVVVTDTLSELLDMGTFLQGPASHPYTVAFKPGRVVEWRFADIQLPDSVVNEPASHGLVSFRIKPAADAVPGTTITNKADIYFDFNPPVRTPAVSVAVALSTGLGRTSRGGSDLIVSPNPTKARIDLRMSDGSLIEEAALLSIDGRSIRRNINGLHQLEWSLDGLSPGTYLVSVRTSAGNWHQRRFVKE
ncbi:MAG TPA: T9SS type A sorting domain-containing protein [Flavobacteriales bacterium]|nr:T9SS type A sorting domain-containing protein [Flavobacteriales bacterium]